MFVSTPIQWADCTWIHIMEHESAANYGTRTVAVATRACNMKTSARPVVVLLPH